MKAEKLRIPLEEHRITLLRLRFPPPSSVLSSSCSSSNRDGGRPTLEWSQESNYRSSATGPSGIPRYGRA